MRQHSLRLPDDLWDQVEVARGDVNRNLWVIRAIEEKLHPLVRLKAPSVEDANALVLKANPPPILERGENGLSRPVHAANCKCPVCKPPKRTT